MGEFIDKAPNTSDEFVEYYTKNKFEITYSKVKINFKEQTVYNDYENFMSKVYHSILAI
jgi:hypothetical protein